MKACKGRAGRTHGDGIRKVNIQPARRRGDLVTATPGMMMRNPLVGIGWHLVGVAFVVAKSIGCDRDAVELLGGMRDGACPKHQDKQQGAKQGGPAAHGVSP